MSAAGTPGCWLCGASVGCGGWVGSGFVDCRGWSVATGATGGGELLICTVRITLTGADPLSGGSCGSRAVIAKSLRPLVTGTSMLQPPSDAAFVDCWNASGPLTVISAYGMSTVPVRV